MLIELRIENLLVIERAELRLGPGLNAITGETGAGKTVLAHSLDLLTGGRARPQIVRPGASEAYVEGVFELPAGLLDGPEFRELAERLPDDASEIVLGRRVGASGRTTAFVQGRSASASDLQRLGARLLAFYGQHEHRRLTLSAVQADVLDAFIGPEHLDLRRRYRDAHAEAASLCRELAELNEREGARARDVDLLRFELSEIEDAAPDPEEERELDAERLRLRHAEQLRESAAGALAAFTGGDGDGGASGLIAQADSLLASVAEIDPELAELGARTSALGLEAADLAADLRARIESDEAEPGRLAEIEERLELLARLKRKHGGSADAVLEHAERCRSQIAELEGADERCEQLEGEVAAAESLRDELAVALTKARSKAAPNLEQRVAEELAPLAMEGASLEVVLEPHGDGLGPLGAETVELRVATNPGMPAGALRDAASGGELSRMMLALSSVGRSGEVGTIVFDEIDAGIGGNTARAVGERLRDLARADGSQVLCITHLPQIAALANTNFSVSKRSEAGATVAEVALLEGEELVAEIRRMLGGEGHDKAATKHARELLAA